MKTVPFLSILLVVGAGRGEAARPARGPAGPGVVKKLLRTNQRSSGPAVPVRIEVRPGMVLPGGGQRMLVVVTPETHAPRLDITVIAEAGIRLAAGAPTASFPAVKGQSVTHAITLAGAGAGERRLIVTATLRLPRGRAMSGQAAYVLNPLPRDAAEARHPGGRRVTMPDGREVFAVPAGK
jgi:hypothetical protein